MTRAVRPEPSDGNGSGAFLRCFGQQVKLFRERADMTQADLGAQLGYGADQIASVERGRRIPKPEMIETADRVLEAGGVLIAMKDEVARARYPAFFRDAARLEAEAVELHSYDAHNINGLLQSEDYARALFGMARPSLDDDVIEQWVSTRMARQEILIRRPLPTLSFVIEEAVLRRPLGGKQVLRGQLQRLLVEGRKRNVEVQVMPTDRTDHAGMAGPFALFSPKGGDEVAYMEGQGRSTIVTGREEVRAIASRYGIIRAQALTPSESLGIVEQLLGEL